MPPTARQIVLLPENRSAFEALAQFAKRSANSHRKTRLVYLYGPSGTGKSLLVSKFVRDVLRRYPKFRSATVTASTFAAELAEASESRSIDRFQSRYRELDLFVCEDLQALRKRKESQTQLIFCLDQLFERGSLVVLTANGLPGHWSDFDPRLKDRCHGGLSISIELPSTTSRTKLIQQFAQDEHLPFPSAAAKLMARELEFSPRELESSVKHIREFSRQTNCNISTELVERFLKQEVTRPEIPLARIVRQTAKYFGLKVRDLKSDSRRADIVRARQFAMYLARHLTGKTQQNIARELKKADHTSVIRAERKIGQMLESDPNVRQQKTELKNLILHETLN